MELTHSRTHSWSWALLEKPPIVQLLKNFSIFYGTRMFITVFTRALCWSLSWVRSIQSILSHPVILILSTNLRLGLLSGLFPSGFLLSPRQVADRGDGLQLWRVAENILNNQSWTAEMGGPPALGLCVGLTTPHRKKYACYERSQDYLVGHFQ
jgi:hypothetical protein